MGTTGLERVVRHSLLPAPHAADRTAFSSPASTRPASQLADCESRRSTLPGRRSANSGRPRANTFWRTSIRGRPAQSRDPLRARKRRQAGPHLRLLAPRRHGSLTFLPLSNLPFLEDLASCRAVISTAGNQLIGEAIFLGKPCLVMPERCVEQRLNAAAVERMGIGMRVSRRQFHAGKIREFLERRPEFVRTMSENVRDGLEESLCTLRQFMHELVPSAEAAGRPRGGDRRPSRGLTSSHSVRGLPFLRPSSQAAMRILPLISSIFKNRRRRRAAPLAVHIPRLFPAATPAARCATRGE